MSDSSWIEALRRGEAAAWNRFFDEMGPLVLAIGLRLGLAREECDDVFQQTAVRVMTKLGDLRRPESFASWVYGIALRLSHDARRKARAVPDPEPTIGRAESPGPRGLEELERLERLAALEDALLRLDARCRDLLRVLYLEDPRPSYREVAQRFDLPIGSIGPTRGRCLHKLEKALSEVFEDGRDQSRDRRS